MTKQQIPSYANVINTIVSVMVSIIGFFLYQVVTDVKETKVDMQEAINQ